MLYMISSNSNEAQTEKFRQWLPKSIYFDYCFINSINIKLFLRSQNANDFQWINNFFSFVQSIFLFVLLKSYEQINDASVEISPLRFV